MPVINPTPQVPFPIAPGPAPCGWLTETSCCDDWLTYTNTQRDRATAWATQILWALSGRQFGACEVTVRPCGSTCNVYGGWMSYPVLADGVGTIFSPFIRDGSWFNCGCSGGCTCDARCSVYLPGPVAAVTSVVVDGIVLADTSYRVDNREILVRTDGECFPECQDMNLNGPAEGTFEVTYARGKAVPLGGQIAAGLLACEFAKACAGADCRLPSNLSSLARQGIEVTMIDPTDVLDAGLTGIPNVDLWIRSVNPARLAQRPKVFSPDLHYPTMRTS